MTRRKIIFIGENGERWISPEFNGDKDEFETKRKNFSYRYRYLRT